jgi:YVTN family beta-propeller protein
MRPPAKVAFFVAAGSIMMGLYAGGLPPFVRKARTTHPKTGQPLLVPGPDGEATVLHNGWRIQPAGRHLSTGDMLLGASVSPDGKTLAVVNAGYNANALHLIDVATEKEVASVPLFRAWNGIAWGADSNKVYVSGGIGNSLNDVYVVGKNATGEWERKQGISLGGADKAKTLVGGLAMSRDGKYLYAANNSDHHVYAVRIATGETVGRVRVGDHPGVCRVGFDKDGSGERLYVANWGGGDVAVVDVNEPEKRMSVTRRFLTDDHPNDLAFTQDGRMFVSCGNADSVTVHDVYKGDTLETVKTSITPNAPSGSTPNALALSPDGKTLYVANADNNSVCVVDVADRGRSRVRGFIPTGWYPTAVAVSQDGKKVMIGSGKGTGTGPNAVTLPINKEVVGGFQHHGKQLKGILSFVDAPTDAQLAAYTKTVYANTPYNDTKLVQSAASSQSAIPAKIDDPTPIKYVLYIIKENRTYDQVFGDMPRGNGDPNLCLFGRDVTPNHHALAEQFVLLDNLYCNGEVSQDGHPWSTSAIATDFTQRAWVMAYSGKGQTVNTPSVTDPEAGFLWEACKRKGLTYRSYGEYAGHKSLEGHVNLQWIGKAGPNQPAPGRDYEKADLFIQEFKEFERNGTIPRFMVMSLGEDHTRGTTPGAFTPKAAVASNDLALGKIVEAISKSSVWNEFAIFVIEDDAQNGPDHVDSHRTVGLVISPYTKRGHMDSTMYQTASMLRTMELILGLPPLTQYDAAATPLYASFTGKADLSPYTTLPPRIDLNATNKATAYGARESQKMDWSEYDRIDMDALNRILWHSIKGEKAPMPAPVRRALVSASGLLRHNAVVLGRDGDD